MRIVAKAVRLLDGKLLRPGDSVILHDVFRYDRREARFVGKGGDRLVVAVLLPSGFQTHLWLQRDQVVPGGTRDQRIERKPV
jgi:hypothetical protein